MLIIISSFATLLAIWLLNPLARRIGLVDLPNERKVHQGAVPLIGGIAIFIGFSVVWFLSGPLTGSRLIYTFCALAIVILGAVDDARNLSVRFRLLCQTGISLFMCWGTGKYLGYFGDLFGFGPIDLGVLGVPLAVLAVISAINAFNMIDGIDGLAGSLALVSLSAIGFMLSLSTQHTEATMAIILALCLLPYLAVNLTIRPFKRKIFMGDAGSMLLGLSVVWLLIHSTQNSDAAFRPVAALWFIAIPLMDMAAVTIRRLKLKQSPFKAARDHFHHQLMHAGFTARQTLVIITTMSVGMALIGLAGELLAIPEWLMFAAFIAVFVAYSSLVAEIKTVKKVFGVLIQEKVEKIEVIHPISPNTDSRQLDQKAA